MKIGILTFHRSINYGAVTQCYALATQLKNDFPDDQVEVIDYTPRWRAAVEVPSLRNFVFCSVKAQMPALLKIKIVLAKVKELVTAPSHYTLIKARYNSFQKSMECLPLSKAAYWHNDEKAFREAISGQYDLIVVGSDCVWSWAKVPSPSPYYLCGDVRAVKACYAASAGTDRPDALDAENQALLRGAIADFDYVGLRDSSTEFVVKTLCPAKPFFHNCDPTTLLDVQQLQPYRERVIKKLAAAGIDFQKPIICIMGNEIIGKLARSIFGESVQYLGVYVPNRFCDVFLSELEVLEWATVFGLCKLTFTTFFHGTMLSLVNHTPVLSFDYLPETDQQITKLHELYNRLKLPGFYHRGKSSYQRQDMQELGMIAQKLVRDPPKQEIADAIKKEAQYYDSFRDFLKSLHEK